MSTAACAHRDVWLDQVPEDGDEGSDVVHYNGTAITVYFTIYDGGIDIDGIEHAGLALDVFDMSSEMKQSLVAELRSKWDSEAEAA